MLDLLRRIISKKYIADVYSDPGELVQIEGRPTIVENVLFGN